MLNLPTLDDQLFDEIMERALKKIPYIYSGWTDFNAHDPGVTFLELFAWYKEMQQYQLDQVTERNTEAFLKLLGILRKPIQPAACVFSPICEHTLPASTKLVSDAGVPFETISPVAKTQYAIGRIYTARTDGLHEVSDILEDGRTGFYAFGASQNEAQTPLYVEIKMEQAVDVLALYIAVDDPWPIKRNAFAADTQSPRKIAVVAGDAGETLEILRDDTHALSCSGTLLLHAKGGLPRTENVEGLAPGYYIKLYLEEAGCEEMPRIRALRSGYARAEQRITLSNQFSFSESSAGDKRYFLPDMLAITGHIDAFIRDAQGWKKVEAAYKAMEENGIPGMEARINADDTLALDGGANIRFVACDPVYRRALVYEGSGLPAQRLRIPIIEGMPIAKSLMLMGGKRLQNGEMRYRDYIAVDDLYHTGKKDRVCELDFKNKELVFGDNITGWAPENGETLYIASLAYTSAEAGGVTPGAMLCVQESGAEAGIALESSAGAPRENADEMKARLLDWLALPKKAVTAEDYEIIAKTTPGLRMHQAKALPLFDPKEPAAKKAGHITVVVTPFAPTVEFPSPSETFLNETLAYLELHRTVCTKIHVMGAAYIGVQIWAELIVKENGAEKEAKEKLARFFKMKGGRLGAPLLKADIAAAVSEAKAVLGIVALELRASDRNCKKNSEGDLLLPPYAIAYLQKLEIYTTLQ